MPGVEINLEVANLRVDVFDECIAAPRRIVSDVSFVLPAGSGIGITGESGSGKSTLSLALSDLLPIGSRVTAGHIALQSASTGVSDSSPHAPGSRRLRPWLRRLRGKHVFTLFQEPRASLNPYRTIGWQLDRCLKRMPPAAGPGRQQPVRGAAADALQSVGLEPDIARHYPHELSTGMCQRVFLAMASLLGSSILVADEPFASVDPATQAKLVALVRDWMRARRVTLILVSHDLGLLRQLTEQTLVIYRGHVAEYGLTSDVLSGERPGHPYTRLLRDLSESENDTFSRTWQFPTGARSVPCCFATRCMWADTDNCNETVPAYRVDKDTQEVLPRQIRCVRHPVAELNRVQPRLREEIDERERTDAEILCVDNVTKNFVTGWFRPRVRRVLENVSFSVFAGERLGIVGASGQGKTTLARIVLGLIRPTAGQVQFVAGGRRVPVDQRRVRERLWFRHHVQMVYQDTDLVLDPGERIGDALLEAYRVFRPTLTTTEAYAHANRLLVELALPDGLLEAYPYRLSGGERKRIALARSLAALGCPFPAAKDDPWRLLILDEPTAGIDGFLQAILSRFLLWAQRRLRLSYLVISHDEAFVRRFCHRALRLDGGHVSWDSSHGKPQIL